jgi:hypothetical protein
MGHKKSILWHVNQIYFAQVTHGHLEPGMKFRVPQKGGSFRAFMSFSRALPHTTQSCHFCLVTWLLNEVRELKIKESLK